MTFVHYTQHLLFWAHLGSDCKDGWGGTGAPCRQRHVGSISCNCLVTTWEANTFNQSATGSSKNWAIFMMTLYAFARPAAAPRNCVAAFSIHLSIMWVCWCWAPCWRWAPPLGGPTQPRVTPPVDDNEFTIMEKASTGAFSLLKAPTCAFTFSFHKNLLRHYAK